MVDPNPYSSPRAAPVAAPAGATPTTPIWRLIVAWEKLRIAYLAWLSVVSLAVFAAVGFDALPIREFRFWAMLNVGFIGANLCFTAGHVVEIFFAVLGMSEGVRRRLRGVIFVLGVVFATVLTVLWIAVNAGV